jgi:uracil-DNA glycosylase family 4
MSLWGAVTMRTPFKRTQKVVRGIGPADAQIILVGEAPGRDEVFWGEPFVGQAGELQQQEGWGPVGIQRAEVRIENVCEERPPRNDLESFAPRRVAFWQQHLRRRLDHLLSGDAQGRCVVPVGNLALATCLGDPLPLLTHGPKAGGWRTRKPAGIQWKNKISQYRGSLLEYKTSSGVAVRMIPTVHPAAFLHGNTGYEAWRGDWQRIAREVAAGCPPLVEGTDRVAQSGAECKTFHHRAQCSTIMAVDLETAGEHLLIAGFAVSADDSFVIPLVDQQMRPIKWGWFWLAKLLALETVKIFHNGLFDTYLLRWHKLPVHRWRRDTLGQHHLLDPSDRHSLAYCASRDLRTVFWKEEAKETEVGPRGGLRRKLAELDQLARYCGKDARHTFELAGIYERRLWDQGLTDIYEDHYKRVMWACLDLSLEGMAVDEVERARLHAEALSRLEALRHEMAAIAGYPLNTGPRVLKSGKKSKAKSQPKGGLSNPAIMKYFYEDLKIKPYMKGGKRTCDEVAVRRMQVRWPKKAAAMAVRLIEFRHQEKKAQFTAPTRLDRDGRMRSLFRPLTNTGRCRAQTPPTGVGTNLQNQLRSIRGMFVARKPGHLLLELDESQAESRLVDGASGDQRALELARTPPTKLDQHRLMASEVLSKEMAEVSQQERENVGKRGRHACNYGMEGARMSEVLIKETEGEVILTPDECQDIIDRVMEARPYIGVWQEWVRDRIIGDRLLINSYGRHLRFSGRVLSKEDYKEGYAFGPQSDVGCLLTQEGWLPVWSKIKQAKMESRVVHNGHDAFMIDGPVEELWELAQGAIARMTAEREYPGVEGPWTLSMPVGMKIGVRWGSGMTEWKEAERVTHREFKQAAEQLLRSTLGVAS